MARKGDGTGEHFLVKMKLELCLKFLTLMHNGQTVEPKADGLNHRSGVIRH